MENMIGRVQNVVCWAICLWSIHAKHWTIYDPNLVKPLIKASLKWKSSKAVSYTHEKNYNLPTTVLLKKITL